MDRRTDDHTDVLKDIQIEIQIRERDIYRERHIQRKTDTEIDRYRDRQAQRQTGTETDRYRERQIKRKADKEKDR